MVLCFERCGSGGGLGLGYCQQLLVRVVNCHINEAFIYVIDGSFFLSSRRYIQRNLRLINRKGAIKDLAGRFDGRKIGSFLFQVNF